MDETTTLTSTVGIILAGGSSRRMGRDKAALSLDGQTLLDRAVDLLASAGCRVIRVVGRPEHPLGIADSRPGAGPGHAIFDALEQAQRDRETGLLVIPVDMPGLSATSLKELMTAGSRRCCAWSGNPLPVFLAAAGPLPDRQSARSVYSLLDTLGVDWLPMGGERAAQFSNINEPGDLVAFLDKS